MTAEYTTGPGAPYYMALYYGGETAGEAAAAKTATADFLAALMPVTSALLAGLTRGDVEVVNEATGQTTAVHQSADVAFVGGSGADALPWASQVLARWRTGDYVAGREIRGRTYIPGAVDINTDDGVLLPAAVVAYDAILENHLVDGDTVAAGGRVIYSPTHQTSSQVNAHSVWNQLAVMRTRRP